MSIRDRVLPVLGGVYDRLRGQYMYKVGAAVLLVTAVLLAAGYFTFTGVQADVQADAEETLTNSAEREAAGIEGFVDDRSADALRLSKSEEIAEWDDQRRQAEFEEELARLPETVEAIHYFDNEDFVVETSTDDQWDGRDIQQGEYPWSVGENTFARPSNVRPFEPYDDEGSKLLGFATQVSGQESHTIILVVNLEARSELLESPVDGGLLQVVSHEDGSVVLAQDLDTILGDHFLIDELDFLTISNTRTRIDQVSTDSEMFSDSDLTVASAPIDGARWSVMAIAPQSTIFETAENVSQSLLILIGIALLGLVSVGAVITRDINKSLDQMNGYAEEIESGNLDVEIDQSRTDEFGELSTLFVRIRDTLDDQLTEVETQATEADQAREQAEQAQAEAESAKEEAEQLSSHLEGKAAAYLEGIEAAADGDLSQRLDPDSRSQAMTDIGEAINEMFADIEGLVVQIQDLAEEVDRKSSDVTESTADIRRSSTEVADSIEEISAGADDQSQKLTRAAQEMNQLSATVEEIASSSQEVAERSMEAAEEGQQSMDTATDTVAQMEAVETKASATASEMEDLQSEVQRISEIVQLIDDIAEQTNMLALNASIEAARAGEAGEGFAVVADEIKSLAEETGDATGEVEELVTQVEASTESVAADMFEMESEVEAGRQSVDETVESLESIAEKIEAANDGIQSINGATDEQAASTDNVVTMVDEVSGVSDRTANEAQNVSAAAEEQTSAIEQISASADSLSERAEKLGSLAEQFETSE